MKSVFIDSSVLFTATNSPTGGSAKLFTLANIKLQVSPLVLTETERNVRSKLHSYQLQRFFKLVEKTQILNQKPDPDLIIKAKKVIAEKDAVILAEAKQAKCDFLVTLDKKDFLNEKVAIFLKPSIALTPKDLIGLLQPSF
ncbi:MAG TPA: PIN domain-containing protein [Patescibacteria group bacterium]|nr:PIN domain-containing protein [Patescibacteria group bacterium]